MVDSSVGRKGFGHTIGDFAFRDQNNQLITQNSVKGRVFVVEYFFTTCGTICPKMNFELNKVYEVYKNNPKVNFLSHTIDPERDSISRLKDFKSSLSLNENWHFVTGNKDSIFNIATKSYFTTAYPDEKEPGGLVHGGGFLLVDKNRHIRGVYDGTNPEETKRLISDIKILLDE
jgi:protein SCO1/2